METTDPSKMPSDHNSSLNLDLTLRLGPPSNNIEAKEMQVARDVTPSDVEKKRSCKECGVMNTPTWRKGPDGPRTLCNKCGLRHSRALRNAVEDWQLDVQYNYISTNRKDD